MKVIMFFAKIADIKTKKNFIVQFCDLCATSAVLPL